MTQRSDNRLPLERYVPFLINQLTMYTNRTLREALREKGMTVPRWRITAILSTLGAQNIGSLSELTMMEQSTVSRVVDQMERDRLVVRKPFPSNNRIVEVHLLPRGRSMFKHFRSTALNIGDRLIADFTPADKVLALRLLRRMIDNISKDRPF